MKKLLLYALTCLSLLSCKQYTFARGDIAGIDVSHHQGHIDWKKVKAELSDEAFVYIKCTEGKTYQDENYKKYAKGAKSEGLLIGGYHYFRMTSSPADQFVNFKKALDNIDANLIPMVDVETTDGFPVKEVQDSLLVFLNLLENEYGKRPMIYGTMRSYNSICAPKFNKYPLYIGRYGKEDPIINGQSHYTIWQYSDSSNITGISKQVDVCKFHKNSSIDDIKL